MGMMGTRLREPPGEQPLSPIERAVLNSKQCVSALRMAGRDQAGVLRAYSFKPLFTQATQQNGGDPRLLGAIALQETNADPHKDSADGGWGLFQLTRQRGVSYAKAHNPGFAANYAAALLARNGRQIARQFPQFTPADRLLATAASYNLGPNKFSGNPATIDSGSVPNGSYGHRVLALMNCFPDPW